MQAGRRFVEQIEGARRPPVPPPGSAGGGRTGRPTRRSAAEPRRRSCELEGGVAPPGDTGEGDERVAGEVDVARVVRAPRTRTNRSGAELLPATAVPRGSRHRPLELCVMTAHYPRGRAGQSGLRWSGVRGDRFHANRHADRRCLDGNADNSVLARQWLNFLSGITLLPRGQAVIRPRGVLERARTVVIGRLETGRYIGALPKVVSCIVSVRTRRSGDDEKSLCGPTR